MPHFWLEGLDWPGFAPASAHSLSASASFLPSSEGCWPGVARQLLTFLLLRQKKSKQKKRRPCVCVPSLRCGQPAVLGPAGVKNNSPAAQTSFCPDPSGPALLGAYTRGGEEDEYRKPNTN